MRGLGMCAALALALAGSSLVVAEAPRGVEFQRPGAGRGPAKPGEKKEEPAKDGEKKDGEAKEGEKKPDAPAAPAAAEKWEEKKIEKLPDNDKSAQDALKKAWDSVYSAQAKGMKKLASDAALSLDLSAMGMGVGNIDLKLAWEKGKQPEAKVVEPEGEKAADPMAGMIKNILKRQVRGFERTMGFVVGWESFDDQFKDKVFVSESRDDATQVIRAWEKKGDGFVSTLYTISQGSITRQFNAESDLKFDYETKGRDKFFSKVTTKFDASAMGQAGGGAAGGMPGGMPMGPGEAEFSFLDRTKFGEFQVAQKVTSKISMMGMSAATELKLTGTKVNDEVTQEMIDAAKDAPAKSAEAPAKEDKKPAETGGGKAPAAGGEAKKPATGEGK